MGSVLLSYGDALIEWIGLDWDRGGGMEFGCLDGGDGWEPTGTHGLRTRGWSTVYPCTSCVYRSVHTYLSNVLVLHLGNSQGLALSFHTFLPATVLPI